MTRTSIRLLLVEDDEAAAEIVEVTLGACFRPTFAITRARRLGEAMEFLSRGAIDLVLSDLGLPDSAGLDGCRRILGTHPDVPLVVLTGMDDDQIGIGAVRLGAQDFLVKGCLSPEVLARSLAYAVERHAMLKEVEHAAREARTSEARLKSLIRRTAEGSVVLDGAGTIRFLNPAAETLLGSPGNLLLGTRFDLALPGASPSEVLVRRPDGTSFPAEVRVTDIEWEGGPSSLVSLRDLSDRKRAERVAIAQTVQRAFLPERMDLRTGSIEMSGLNELCEDASGDYYDFVELPDGRVAVPIGDVTGHGLGPALLMAQARAFLRAFCRHPTDVPGMMAHLNESLVADMTAGRFMSLFLAIVDPKTGAISWANAGHVPALLWRARTDTVEPLGSTGIVLGVVPGAVYGAGEDVVLEPGDVLLLCSDGATEATSRSGEQFGARLAEALGAAAASGATEILDALRTALDRWTGGRGLADDLTLVAIRHAGARNPAAKNGTPRVAAGAAAGAAASRLDGVADSHRLDA